MKKALRLNEGKPPLGYILTFPEAVKGLAEVCQHGENKYAMYNYRLSGKPATEYIHSLLRHLSAWVNGENIDPESLCSHLHHVVFNALALDEFVTNGTAIDDRPHVVLASHEKGPDKV